MTSFTGTGRGDGAVSSAARAAAVVMSDVRVTSDPLSITVRERVTESFCQLPAYFDSELGLVVGVTPLQVLCCL